MGVFHPLSITYTNTIIIFLSFLFFIHAMQLAGSWFSNQGLNCAPAAGPHGDSINHRKSLLNLSCGCSERRSDSPGFMFN